MTANFIKTGLLIAMSAVIFTSCKKSGISDSTEEPKQPAISLKQMVTNPQFAKAYKEMEASFKAQRRNAGAEFVAPFFTYDGFGIGQNMVTEEWCDPLDPNFCVYQIISGQMAFFGTELGPKDFLRKNPDGTVTVHINSKIASASHYDAAPGIELTGDNAKLNMSYTGPVISFDIHDEDGNVIFTINYIDWWSSQRGAVSFHGNGKVRQGNTGPFKNLVSKMVVSAGQGQGQGTTGFTLN